MENHPVLYLSCAFIAGIICTTIIETSCLQSHHEPIPEASFDVSEERSRSIIKAIKDHLFRSRQSTKPDIPDGIESCIGNTPLLRIRSLSEATGCDIFAKAEVNCKEEHGN